MLEPVNIGSHTASVISALRDAGFLVGEAHAPAGGGWQGQEGTDDFRGFIVVSGGDARYEGSLTNRHLWAVHLVQIVCVGRDGEMADWLRFEAQKVLLDKSATSNSDVRVQLVKIANSRKIYDDNDSKIPIVYAEDWIEFTLGHAL